MDNRVILDLQSKAFEAKGGLIRFRINREHAPCAAVRPNAPHKHFDSSCSPYAFDSLSKAATNCATAGRGSFAK